MLSNSFQLVATRTSSKYTAPAPSPAARRIPSTREMLKPDLVADQLTGSLTGTVSVPIL